MNLLTIIIPYKDIASYLERLLNSIFCEIEQGDAQVIVINDKSTENLEEYGEICRRFDGKVQFIDNTSDVTNAGAARNIGLKNANGKWLLFADSDDSFVNGWYKTVQSYFDSDSDIVYFTPTSVNEYNLQRHGRHVHIEAMIDNYLNAPETEEDNLRLSFVVPWSKMVRRDLVTSNGFRFDEVRYSNDYLFSVECGLAAKKVAATKECIYCVTRREGSLITDRSEQVRLQRLRVSCRVYNYVRSHMESDRFYRLPFSLLWFHTMKSIVKPERKRRYSRNYVISVIRIFHENKIPVLISPKCIAYGIKRRIDGSH